MQVLAHRVWRRRRRSLAAAGPCASWALPCLNGKRVFIAQDLAAQVPQPGCSKAGRELGQKCLNGRRVLIVQVLAAQVPQFDCSKARRELGLTFIDVQRTAQDMAAALLELELVRRLPGAPVGSFYPTLAKL